MERTVVVKVRTQANCFSRETDKFHGIGGAGVVDVDAGAGGKLEGNGHGEAESCVGNKLEVGGRFSFSSSSRTSSVSASCSLMLALKVAL